MCQGFSLRLLHRENSLSLLSWRMQHRGPSTPWQLRFARSCHCAQDDRFLGHFISTITVLVVSFPKMSITFTTTVYSRGSAYSCFTDTSSFGFLRVR